MYWYPIFNKFVAITIFMVFTCAHSRRDPASNQLINYKRKRASRSIIQTNWGAPVDDIANILTVGPKGLMPVHDIIAIDVIYRHVRSRLSPRVGQARAAGASGFFVTTNDITRYSRAVVFNSIGKKTRVSVRFCLIGGDVGTPDTTRSLFPALYENLSVHASADHKSLVASVVCDHTLRSLCLQSLQNGRCFVFSDIGSGLPRGFSIKFYTKDGIWDLIAITLESQAGSNPLKLINFLNAVGRNPVTNLVDFDQTWDYLTLNPEFVYNTMQVQGEGGRPDGYRHADYFGQNTYKMSNSDGTPVYVKFHLKTNQGVRSLPPEVARNLTAIDPDYATRDLYNNIAVGNFPSWTLYIQVMTFEEAERYPYSPFDAIRPWPRTSFPLIEVGKIVLNKNPKNYFAEVEQIALNPSHMIPGIEPSPDKLLQGRLLAYTAAQQYRLGTNFHQLPINRPFKTGVTNYQSGGQMEIDNQDGAPTYYPNSFGGPENLPSAAMSICYVSGDVARHNITPPDTTDLARDMWLSLSEEERENLVASLADEIRLTAGFIKKRAIKMFMQVATDFGRRIRREVNRPAGN